MSSGAKLIRLTRTLIGRFRFRVIDDNNATHALTRTKVPIAGISSCAKSPRVLNNQMGALRPHVRNNVLTQPSVTRSRTSLATGGVHPFSLIIIGLCPFRRAVTGRNIALPRTVRRVSVNNPAVIQTTTGGRTCLAVLYRPGRCTSCLRTVQTDRNRIPLDFHRTYTRTTF